MNVNEAIEYIHSVFWQGSPPGLHRVKTLLAKMGNPEKKLKFVHVAGTNGKGSTASMIASILRKAGYRAGLYTSPYIYRFHERIQLDGEQISDEDLVAITEFVKPLLIPWRSLPRNSNWFAASLLSITHGKMRISWYWRLAWAVNSTPPTSLTYLKSQSSPTSAWITPMCLAIP
jgi:hypothetical protein